MTAHIDEEATPADNDNDKITGHTPADNRKIRRLKAQRFYWAVAFLYSLFLNIVLIWEYKL